jgi:hypothetical protein
MLMKVKRSPAATTPEAMSFTVSGQELGQISGTS